MPTVAEIVSIFSNFVTDNVALVAGAIVVGLVAAAFARLIRSGR